LHLRAIYSDQIPRIPGPMLNRKVPHVLGGIDIHIEVPRVDCEKLSSNRLGESSASIRELAQAARERQRNALDPNWLTDELVQGIL
jgi:magnesium chelatase family protein